LLNIQNECFVRNFDCYIALRRSNLDLLIGLR
jgi:hypothetical protein